MAELILQDFLATLPGVRELVRVLTRMFAALAVGALVGFQRERMGKAAGSAHPYSRLRWAPRSW